MLSDLPFLPRGTRKIITEFDAVGNGSGKYTSLLLNPSDNLVTPEDKDNFEFHPI
jgi:hypothetical protein